MKRFSAILVLALTAAGTLFAAEQKIRMIPLEEMSRRDVATTPHDGRHLFLKTAVFDPTIEAPDFDRAGLPRAESGGYAIVQFKPRVTGAKDRFEKAGVRFYGYLPENAFQVKITSGLRALLVQSPDVRWIGDYEPGYKIHPRLRPGSGDPTWQVTLQLFPDSSVQKVAMQLSKRFTVKELERLADPAAPMLRFRVAGPERDDFVRAAAAIPAVSWIEPYDAMHIDNIDSSGPIQGNVAGDAGRTIFHHGITGTGQIVGVADSGVDNDMCFFRNFNGLNAVTSATNTMQPAPGPTFPNQKVFAYWVQEGGDAYDTDAACTGTPNEFHGTHTSGSAVGDNPAHPATATDPGIDVGDGMAPHAQLLFQDIGGSDGCLDGLTDIYSTLLQAMNGGARVHSNSYGSDTGGAYTFDDQTVDRFLYDHDDMTVFFSAGNAGPAPQSVGSPANAKNAISVGALGHGNSTNIAIFSSRGRTEDGRVKPDILAPGTNISSASGDDVQTDGNCGTKLLSGTSMASPTATGGAALLREYFSDGFYPTGATNAADKMEVHAPLVKAVLLNGTLALPSPGQFPDTNYGWGRIFLDNNLFFPGDSRKLRIWDVPNSAGLATGSTRSYTVNVAAGQEFRATLVWMDPEGTLGAATSLVNDLNLSVSDGTNTYLGNVTAGGTSTTGGSADSINTVEQVRLPTPAAGTYTITVHAQNVPGNGRALTNRQGYSLVASYAACTGAVTGAPSALLAVPDSHMGVDLSWSSAGGSTVTQIYRADGTSTDFRLVGTSTGSSFVDSRAEGGLQYKYEVRGADDCGEGPASNAVSTIPTGLCDLTPEFLGVDSAVPDGNKCQIDLTWAAATSNCQLGRTIQYNIYRSTSPGFIPSGAPIASVTGTSYQDKDVVNGQTYYYVVRAEDSVTGSTGPHGGNEEANLVRVFATATGSAGSTLGTWLDDGGDTAAFLSAELPWQVGDDAQSGAHAYHTGIDGGTYPDETCASVTTPALKLGTNAQLSYFAKFNIEFQWDGVVVEISSDGGTTWTNLPPSVGYPNTLAQTLNPPINACGFPSTQGAFTGPDGNAAPTAWTQYTSTLAGFAGQTVRIRWRLSSDPGASFEGFFLDTIAITNVDLPTPCTVVAAAPDASFTTSRAFIIVGVPVTFQDRSENIPTSWLWNFGDGATSNERNPTHTFTQPGDFTVQLTASNALGSGTDTEIIHVSPAPADEPRHRAIGRH